MLKAQGNLLLDDKGAPFRLLGAQIESPLNYFKRPLASTIDVLNVNVFKAMATLFNFNSVRIPISCWTYQQPNYLTILDTAIQQANAEGLYVVLDLHDDGQSGSPHVGSDYPKLENIAFWHDIATRYKDNPLVIFDVYNEPKIANWTQWLSGDAGTNGVACVGFKALIDAVRSAGATQPIVLAGGGHWTGFDPSVVSDTNVIYTRHIYESVIDDATKQAAAWGVLLDKYPLYFGEWAFLTNVDPSNVAHCQKLPTDAAGGTKAVNDFLAFCDAHQIGWNAWQFGKGHLVVDMTTFAPTSLDVPWTCGGYNAQSGMGTVIQQHLKNAPQPVPVPVPPVPPVPVPPVPPQPQTEEQLLKQIETDTTLVEGLEAKEGTTPQGG